MWDFDFQFNLAYNLRYDQSIWTCFSDQRVLSHFSESHFADSHFADSHFAVSHFADSHFAESHGASRVVIMQLFCNFDSSTLPVAIDWERDVPEFPTGCPPTSPNPTSPNPTSPIPTLPIPTSSNSTSPNPTSLNPDYILWRLWQMGSLRNLAAVQPVIQKERSCDDNGWRWWMHSSPQIRPYIYLFIPEQFTVKSHPALRGRGEPKMRHCYSSLQLTYTFKTCTNRKQLWGLALCEFIYLWTVVFCFIYLVHVHWTLVCNKCLYYYCT